MEGLNARCCTLSNPMFWRRLETTSNKRIDIWRCPNCGYLTVYPSTSVAGPVNKKDYELSFDQTLILLREISGAELRLCNSQHSFYWLTVTFVVIVIILNFVALGFS